MNILIVGGNGNIGTPITRLLAESNHSVSVLSRHPAKNKMHRLATRTAATRKTKLPVKKYSVKPINS